MILNFYHQNYYFHLHLWLHNGHTLLQDYLNHLYKDYLSQSIKEDILQIENLSNF